MPLSQVRGACAAALAPQTDTDPPVHMDPMELITPPALMLEWNDPWLTQGSIMGAPGLYAALLNVICFAPRATPGPAYSDLEAMVSQALARMQTLAWPLTMAQAPRRFDVGGATYIGLRLSFQVPVSLNGGT